MTKGLLNMFGIPCDAPPDASDCSVLGTWGSSCERALWVPVPAEATAAAWVPVPAGLVFCVGALNGVNVVAAARRRHSHTSPRRPARPAPGPTPWWYFISP